MTSDSDLEARLRSHMAAERHVYQPPAELSSRIRKAIGRGSIPAPRPALMPQLASAVGLIVLVAILSVGAVWIKNGGLSRPAGLAATSPSTTSYRIATVHSDVYLMALITGVLQGKGNPDGTACLWLGDGTKRTALVWPPGYSARGNPLAVYDQRGVRVAVVGKRVSLGGGGSPIEGPYSVMGCSGTFSDIWGVAPNWGSSPK
jgi:hypothetical protein